MLKTVGLCESLQHNECAVSSPQMHATGPGTCIACGSRESRQEHCHRDTKCSCSHCTLSALQHRSACNIWAATETGSYALLALPATLQTGKACHHAHSTPLHASNIQRLQICARPTRQQLYMETSKQQQMCAYNFLRQAHDEDDTCQRACMASLS